MGLAQGIEGAVSDWRGRVRVNLRFLIDESDYSVAQVAVLAGVTEKALRNVLTGVNAPAFDTLIRLAFVLGVRPDEFFDEPEELAARGDARVVPPLALRPRGDVTAGATRSTASASSTSPASAASTETESSRRQPKRAASARKTSADQQQRSARKRTDFSCIAHPRPDQRKHIFVTPLAA